MSIETPPRPEPQPIAEPTGLPGANVDSQGFTTTISATNTHMAASAASATIAAASAGEALASRIKSDSASVDAAAAPLAYEIVTVPAMGEPGRDELRQQCYDVRIAVFSVEQGFPLETEIDE